MAMDIYNRTGLRVFEYLVGNDWLTAYEYADEFGLTVRAAQKRLERGSNLQAPPQKRRKEIEQCESGYGLQQLSWRPPSAPRSSRLS